MLEHHKITFRFIKIFLSSNRYWRNRECSDRNIFAISIDAIGIDSARNIFAIGIDSARNIFAIGIDSAKNIFAICIDAIANASARNIFAIGNAQSRMPWSEIFLQSVLMQSVMTHNVKASAHCSKNVS